MYESRRQRPLSRARFIGRMATHGALALALLFAPVLHRILHRFHWDEKG